MEEMHVFEDVGVAKRIPVPGGYIYMVCEPYMGPDYRGEYHWRPVFVPAPAEVAAKLAAPEPEPPKCSTSNCGEFARWCDACAPTLCECRAERQDVDAVVTVEPCTGALSGWRVRIAGIGRMAERWADPASATRSADAIRAELRRLVAPALTAEDDHTTCPEVRRILKALVDEGPEFVQRVTSRALRARLGGGA